MIKNLSTQDLRVAILTNQLAISLQPKIDLTNFSVIGYEALMRWEHPTLGQIPAMQWIQIAEERNLITQLTHWLTHQIAECLSQQNSPIPIAINVAPKSMSTAFAHDFLGILNGYKIDPDLISIELTESQKIHNYNSVLGALNILRRQGIKISLDDFGTGHNTLRTLVEIEVDEIKIDKSLVQSDHPNSPFILSSIASLAREINLSVVCEGIENNTHLNRALRIQSNIGQGYLFGKPEPIDTIFPYYRQLDKESA